MHRKNPERLECSGQYHYLGLAMNESDYTQAVHKKLPPNVKAWKIRDDYQGGVADAFYRRRDGEKGTPLWVEYKYLKNLPKRDTTLIVADLSELQKGWLTEADEAGEQVRVVIGYESKGVILSLQEAIAGIKKADFVPRLEAHKEVAMALTRIVMNHA